MKYVFYFLIAAAILFACIWSFNHINAWVGIIVTILCVGYGISRLINFIKKQM